MKSLSAITDIVFHATYINQLANILTSNTFTLSTSIGTDADDEHQNGKLFYLSTTRTRLGKYHANNSGYGSVLLTLDGRKLGQRFSGKAIDYWGEEFRQHYKGAYEEEDRVFSDEPTIANAKSYILKIDIFLEDWESKKKLVRIIVREALKYKIPLFFYNDRTSWLSGNVKKSYKIKISDLALIHEKDDKYKYFDRNTTKANWGRGFRRPNDMFVMQELVNVNDYNKLSTEAQKRIYKIVYDSFNEQKTVFKNDVHNNKSKSEYTTKLLALMRKTQTKNANELFNYVKLKWTPILQSGY